MKHIFDLLDDDFKNNLGYLQRIASDEEETVIYFGNRIDVSFPLEFEWWKNNKDFTREFLSCNLIEGYANCEVRFRGSRLEYDEDLEGIIEAMNVKI